MLTRLLPPMMLAITAPFTSGGAPSPAPGGSVLDGTQWAQVTIRERVIIRVPRLGPRAGRDAPAPPAAVTWKEKKGPKCIAIADLRGAAFGQHDTVDFALAGNRRVRALLKDDCPALDFYSGFYLRPTGDGAMCAGRDAIRSRSGAVCPIARFRTLIAQR